MHRIPSAKSAAAAAAAALLFAQSGLAQSPPASEPTPAESVPALPQPEGADDLVNVDLRNVASRIANNLKLDASQIPLSVMVPARVAANVCSMEQALMAQRAAGGGMGCMADHTTSALDAIVEAQMKK